MVVETTNYNCYPKMVVETTNYNCYPTPNGGADLQVEQVYYEDTYDDNRKGLFLEKQKLIIVECDPREDEAWIKANEDDIMSEILNQ